MAGEGVHSAESFRSSRPWAVMVSTPGVVDERAGRVLLSPNLHWSEHADLPWILRQVWSAPVGLVQEVRALALGELGARPDGDDFMVVDISDGVGGALMLGGRIYQGALPMSGEIGHTPIPGNNRLCGCGGRGCLETLASHAAWSRACARRRGTRTQPSTFTDVVSAADKEIPQWMRATFDVIATCVSAALNLYGVRRVVMVGRISELPAPATDYLIGVIQRASMWSRFDAVAVTLAPKRVARGLVIAGIQRFVMPATGRRPRGRSLRFASLASLPLRLLRLRRGFARLWVEGAAGCVCPSRAQTGPRGRGRICLAGVVAAAELRARGAHTAHVLLNPTIRCALSLCDGL